MEQLLTGSDPALVWGLFTRSLGLTYLIALASLYHQILPLAGRRGISPVASLLDRIRTDFPLPQRLLYFPSLLWLGSGDCQLRGLVVVGCGAAGLVIVGGPATPAALLVCWAVYLSLDLAVGLIYPWDCVLLEAGFLALFLPPLEPLPALAAVAAPLPIVALALNLLLVRILWGFGKYKFLGINRKNFGYLKEFLINQPIPTRFGWQLHHWPAVAHRLGLGLLFLVEVPLPLLILVPGPARLFAFGGIAALMLAIQLAGNYGFFNLIVLVLCLPLLDPRSPLLAFAPLQATTDWANGLVHTILAVLFLGGLLYFPFNSWCSQPWLYWPAQLSVSPGPLRRLLDFYRLLAPFRLVHAYGVFPSQPSPGLKFIPVIEGSADGQTWREYEYKYLPWSERTPPRSIAPYHPRWDHFIVYEGYGANLSEFLSAALGGGYNPYLFSVHPPLARAMQRLTEVDSPVRTLFARDPFAGQAPPKLLRATLYAFEPTSPAERARTGRWWTCHRLGTHLPPQGAEEAVFRDWLNGPELFHWDSLIWRPRTPLLRDFQRSARLATTLEAIEELAAEALALPQSTVERFWRELIPSLQPPAANDWRDLAAVVATTRQRFSPTLLGDFERLTALLTIGLAARLEARLGREPSGQLGLPSHFHFGMLLHRLLLRGRDQFRRALTELEVLTCEADQLTVAGGAWLWAVFRFETMMYHVRASCVGLGFTTPYWVPGLPGFTLLGPFLADQALDAEQAGVVEWSRSIRDGRWIVRFPAAAQASAERPVVGAR
jgi:lipase maturation factor